MRHLGGGLELAGIIAVMAWLGWSFDQWAGTDPWGVVVGSLIGVTGGLYNLIKDVIKNSDD